MVSVKVQPPGTILTMMYVKERLKRHMPGKFIEVGPGCSGEISRILLELRWTGTAYELSQDSISILNCRFEENIKNKKFRVKNLDWLKADEFENADLIVSCNVIEHLSSTEEQKFIDKSYSLLNKNGLLIGVVPSSEKHWGIEDDIAGHFRRYSEKMVMKLFDDQK